MCRIYRPAKGQPYRRICNRIIDKLPPDLAKTFEWGDGGWVKNRASLSVNLPMDMVTGCVDWRAVGAGGRQDQSNA
jgi:hypothetical protein